MDSSTSSSRISELESVLGGKYKVLVRVGIGGYGEVYLGEHIQLHRKVAIKFLLHGFAAQSDLVTRFHREARSAAKLIHPNIIDIYDVGEKEDIHYFVMKYIEGETLSRKMLRDKKIAPGEAIQIVKQLADALDYAHSNEVIHRDVKPSNVMIDGYGKPLLMDFGVARIQFESKLTGKGRIVGTPHYLPPEQPLGNPIDGRSDIYSLGILFYEMLAGIPPFHDENAIALVFKHVHESPPALKEMMPELDAGVCNVVHKMIEKLPENRYQTGAEVVEALESLSGVYPQKVALTRRSNPSLAIYNTEKLLMLAREHVEKDKVSKAFQILNTVVKRHPEKETQHKEIQDMVRELIEKTRNRMSHNDFHSAREICGQLQGLSPANQEVGALLEEVTREENVFREAQFRIHFEAAQFALVQNDAASAVSHLSICSSLNSSHEEVQRLLKETRERITSEIDLLCERLDFDTAEYILYLGQGNYPDLFQSKSPDLQHHRSLYQKLQNARDFSKQEKWKEALQAYQEFLKIRPPYGFSVFQSLRAEAELSVKKVQERVQHPSTRQFPVQRIFWMLVIGFFCGGAIIGLSVLLRQQAEVPELQTDLSFLRKLKNPSQKKPTSAQPPEESSKEEKAPTTTSVSTEIRTAPIPARVIFMIETDPNGAIVLLNKKMYGFTPARIESLQEGTYTVTLRKRGYEDYNQTVDVRRADTSNIHVALVPIKNEEPVASKSKTEIVIHPGMIVPLDSDVVPPRLTKQSAITYPEEAKKRGMRGMVKLEVLVSETGSVIAVKVLKSAGPVLDAAASKSVREWVYEPAVKKGIPVSVWVPTTIHYAKP